MDAQTLIDRLNDELQIENFAESDPSENGLQVGTHDGYADRVAFAVDAAVETIEAAADRDADLLVVHHGLSWNGIDRITGRAYDRIAKLIEHDLDLYAAHIPLDSHPELGNAAGLGNLLDLTDRQPFGEYHGEYVGQRGRLLTPLDSAEIELLLDRQLDHDGEGVQVLDFGPNALDEVAIVTGRGPEWLDEAVEVGADAFITGEGVGELYHQAKESGITVFLPGHYATETFGVRALAELVDGWGPTTTVIDAPTGL
ncbi:MAG: Nif3-like dinuclear metal center hexameric protein [Halodesulfurarchaeum sp.]